MLRSNLEFILNTIAIPSKDMLPLSFEVLVHNSFSIVGQPSYQEFSCTLFSLHYDKPLRFVLIVCYMSSPTEKLARPPLSQAWYQAYNTSLSYERMSSLWWYEKVLICLLNAKPNRCTLFSNCLLYSSMIVLWIWKVDILPMSSHVMSSLILYHIKTLFCC